MPRSKATSKSKSSHETAPKPTEKPAPPPEPTTWSNWIWNEEEKYYYRASLGKDKLWQYEYAFGPSPAVLQPIPTTPLNLSRSIPTTPIQCTKEDLELKVVYAPRYSYQPSYTSTPYEYMTMGMREPVVAGTDLTKKGEGKKDTVDKKEDVKGEVKKEAEKDSRPSTPKKQRRTRIRDFARIEAYIEEAEEARLKMKMKTKMKESHEERGHKHSEEKERSL